MGAYRTRRPFVWQDEMSEVRNLFRKVAQVRDGGFTRFSLWKDEPTAQTLSKNRLRRRRCQYALELNHLNYGESPYEALNHLHNIRGMCSRIQRQDRHVERKKKDYDVNLEPALLRRPVTAASYSWATAPTLASMSKEGSEKGCLRSKRPSSAPLLVDTPLHYTPSKPTMLFDATHRRVRYKEVVGKRASTLNPSASSLNRNYKPGRVALKAMAYNHNWETSTVASTGYNSSSPSVASVASTNPNGASSATSLSCGRQGGESSPKLEESTPRRKEPVYADAEVETASDLENRAAGLALYSEVELSDASLFSSSRPQTQVFGAMERPPSRMMSKRPSADTTKAVIVEKYGGNVDQSDAPSRESPGTEVMDPGSAFQSSPSPAIPFSGVLLTRAPSRKAGEFGRLLEEQRCNELNPAGAKTTKTKPALSPSDGTAALWALRQSEQRRPASAGPGAGRTVSASSEKSHHSRPKTSPTGISVQSFQRHERISRFGSSPSANKIAGKEEQLEVRAVQRAFDQELQQVVLSEYGSDETEQYTSTGSEQPELRRPAVSPAQSHQQQHQSCDVFKSRADSSEQTSVANACASARASEEPTATGAEESHVMIKHSTDPYKDFKYSMLRMIDEEDLFDKQWELEELFQYYMDLNPSVHHKVLQLVISDIRDNLGLYKARRCYADSS